MCTTSPGSRPFGLAGLFTRWIVGLFIVLSFAMAGTAAHAAAPNAGTTISNAASATYLDASNTQYMVTSNQVDTVVQQVASLTLAANGTQNANPGAVVYYPHTLTNTGNGSDTFTLAASSTAGTFTMTNVQIFADNGSGQPTGSAITSTGLLGAAGTPTATFKFIVQGTVPNAATASQNNTITVTATSGFGGTLPVTNTDVTTVSNNAVVTLTKAASVSSGPTGQTITYTLTYKNNGNVAATNVAITDVLQAGLTYTSGTLRRGSTTLADTGTPTVSGTLPDTTSSYNSSSKTLLVTLNPVPAGQGGTISFDVTVAAVTPGTAPTTANTATMSYNDSVTTVNGTSNATSFTVTQTASLTLSTPTAVASAAAGTTVTFINTVKNTGNGPDTFNITVGANNFPSVTPGTIFYLYKSDGFTPLANTNIGDAVADTGSLLPGATYDVVVKAVLPPGATTTGAPFQVAVTATSVYDPTKSATANDVLTAISAASVDVTNDSVGGLGGGVFPSGEPAAQVTKSLNPGTSTTFTIVAKNTGAAPDAYDLAVSTTGTFPGALPAGWIVRFLKDGGANNCSTTGADITSTGTGSVAAGLNAVVCAVVSVPANFAAGTTNLYFRAQSSLSSGASDVLHDAVTVNAVRSITLTQTGTGQVSANGSIVYEHTLTNSGNVTEGNGTASTVTLAASNSQATGWTSSLFIDSNGNGTFDAGVDQQIAGNFATLLPGGLAPGASITIFNKVSVTGGVIGALNVTTITASTANGTYGTTAPGDATAKDNTTVVAGNLTLVKAQAVDTGCVGANGGTVYTQSNVSAKPNECVLYKVTVTNAGNVDATSVFIYDSVPGLTTLSGTGTPSATIGGVVTPSAVVVTGSSIKVTVGTLTPATVPATNAAVLTFGVRINP